MDKNRKIIGVIMSYAEGEYHSRLIQGIQKQAYQLDYDVLVFTTFIKDELTPEWQYGEQNIFNVINYDILDGLIIALDTILIDKVADKILDKIKTCFHKPVVSIELEYEGTDIVTIKTEDRVPVKKIVSHLIEEHKLTDIAFVTGRRGHPHSNNRLEGYCEAMVEHGLAIDDTRIFYGDFWYHCADGIIDELYEQNRPLPQAIACACDATAIGICEALKKRGVRVPEDVAVTGYDSVLPGVEYKPSITSCVTPSHITGSKSVRKLHSMIINSIFDEKITEATDIYIGQSCGCDRIYEEKKKNMNERWQSEIIATEFTANGNSMLEDLISVNSLYGFFGKTSWYTYHIGVYESIDICICEDWDNPNENERHNNYLRDGYTPNMYQMLHRKYISNGASVEVDRRFDVNIIVPTIYEKRKKPTTFFITPVHFLDRCFGYSVISYGDAIRAYDMNYRMVIKYVNSGLESFRRYKRLEENLRQARENSITDAMTGIYNRNGFNMYADEMFNNAMTMNKKLLVILGDLNKLKYINDNFGHISGDVAIISAAQAFKNTCTMSKLCFRIGGDEFVMLDMGDYTEEELIELKNNIKSSLEKLQEEKETEFDMRMSVGIFYDYVDNFDKIEQVVSIADNRMFEDKVAMKSQRKK